LAPRDQRDQGADGGENLQHLHNALDALSLLASAKKVAKENGATLVGDKESGRFSHAMFRGAYRIVGQTVSVTITDRHWLVPWLVVESQLRELVQ
jgi:hypothetical protein